MSEFELVVQGKSMIPAFREGDVLLVEKDGVDRIKVGNVVVYQPPEEEDWVVHRVTAIQHQDGAMRLMTQGDNRADPDEIVHPEWLIGKVVARSRNQQRIIIPRWKELFWLTFARWYRRARRIRYRLLRLAMPLLAPLFSARLIPVKRVRIGDRQMTVVFGRVVAIKEDTPQGTTEWIHPLFRRIKQVKSDW